MGFELVCPACGGLIEADDVEELISMCQEHTRDAHGYQLPREHVVRMLAGESPDPR